MIYALLNDIFIFETWEAVQEQLIKHKTRKQIIRNMLQ